MSEKRVHMKHSLAKALLEGAIQHFDDGGMVAPVASGPAQGVATTESGNPGFLGSILGQNNYSANLAPVQQSDYSRLINTAGTNATAGYGTSQDILNQQRGLASQLLAQSQGGGPNPAQAALAQQTGNNASMQAALMASQRGSGANAGLIARQAGQQGGAIQQASIGQAATLQAQQQLQAEQELQAQQQAEAQTNAQEQGINANLLSTAGGLQTGQNNTNVANYGAAQGINASVASGNGKNLAGITGNIIGAAGQGAAAFAGAGFKGGRADHLQKIATIYHPTHAKNFKAGGSVPGKAAVKGDSIKNDTVSALLSPGEVVLDRETMAGPNAPQKAKEFVQHLLEQEGKKSKKGFGAVAESKKDLKGRLEKLEKFCYGGAA